MGPGGRTSGAFGGVLGDLGQRDASAFCGAQNLELLVESAAWGRARGDDHAPYPRHCAWPAGYVDVGLIPAGAREIRIEEVAEAANFLALRSEDPEKYFLNGGWTIQWNGDYQVAGTTFTYARTGNWENLTSPGPTAEPVWIQVPAPGTRVGGAGAGPEGSGGAPQLPSLPVLWPPWGPEWWGSDPWGRLCGWVQGTRAHALACGPAAVPGEQPRRALRVHHPQGGGRPWPGRAARVLLELRALDPVHGHLRHR